VKQILTSFSDIKKALSVYGLAYFVLLVFVFGLQYLYPKPELHLLLNSYHTGIEDTFFKYYSMLAEGPLYAFALLPLFWRKIGMTVFFALSELSGGAVLQILKHLFDFERPVSVFEHYPDMMLPLVQGVDMHHSNSFPSGHASTFFVFFTCCALILAYHYLIKAKQANYKTRFVINLSMLVMLVLAALGAYSRVYLSQHFLSDVCMGSIIGFVSPCLIFLFGKAKIFKLNKE
jgi:membrane-associated phospholipid phosphatase